MSRARALKIGAFTVAALILLIAALLVFAEARLWRDHDSYWARFPYSVSGLNTGARVELWGVPIGDVSSIELDGERVRVGLQVREGVDIPADARATLRFEGVTGLKYIDIVGGDLAGPVLPPGSRIDVVPRDFSQTLAVALEAVDRLDSVLNKLEILVVNANELIGPENRERIARVLEGAAATMENTRDASADVAALTRSVRARGPELLASGEDMAETLAGAAADVRRAAASIASISESAGGQLEAALREIRAAAASVRGWVRALETNPSRLLRGGSSREIPPP